MPRADWSTEKDRTFHDWLFAQLDRDRLNFYSSAFITIKRFGDLIAPYLDGCSRVLDAGCGPGEITCYLAQKFPAHTFLGIDHSAIGVQKGDKNRQRLGLTNVTFQARDFLDDPPPGAFDIVLFLDSFHHFQNPRAVIEAVAARSPRVLLLEPHGDEGGNWIRQIDFDWINTDLQRIRRLVNRMLADEDRAEVLPIDDPTRSEMVPATASHDDATEYRYSPEFYERVLEGFDLDVRGTISGLTIYLDNLYEKTESNALFNRLCVDLFASIDDRLARTGHDVFAKHWLIYGEKPGTGSGRRFDGFTRYRKLQAAATRTPGGEPEDFYAVAYADCQVPRVALASSELKVEVHVINQGSAIWSSGDAKHPVNLGYHWLSLKREPVIFEGVRTTLGGKPIGPHECASALMRILTPERPGRYILQIDMVREHVTWFSAKGEPTVEREILIEPDASPRSDRAAESTRIPLGSG